MSIAAGKRMKSIFQQAQRVRYLGGLPSNRNWPVSSAFSSPLRSSGCGVHLTVLVNNCWTLIKGFNRSYSTHRLLSESKSPDLHRLAKKMPEEGKKPVITVSVDGNISSGKSTLVSNLKELFPKDFSFQVELIPEPLEKWTNLNGHNLMGMFYEDTTKHNFMFQHYVQLTRLMESIKKPAQKLEHHHKGIVRIMERSLQNNRHCFIELARRQGRLQPPEFAVLSEWHNWMEEKFDLDLDLIIYLQSSPETVFNRMQSRGRKEESTVPIEYLQNLHETYEDWLIRGKGFPKNAQEQAHVGNCDNAGVPKHPDFFNQRLIVIDANQSKEEVALQCRNFLRTSMANYGFEANNECKLPNLKKRKRGEEVEVDSVESK